MYEALRNKIDSLLTGPFVEAMRATDCRTPDFDNASTSSADAFRAKVSFGHVSGTPEARYRLEALNCHLDLYVQLNVYRLVVVYRVPAAGTLDSAALRR